VLYRSLGSIPYRNRRKFTRISSLGSIVCPRRFSTSLSRHCSVRLFCSAEELLASGVAIGLYSSKDGHQIAVIRADRISIDHRRMGFFRIGLLPFVAFEKRGHRDSRPVEMARRLSLVQSHFLRAGDDGPAEIHGVKVQFSE